MEHIVVDGSSRDDSVAILGSFAAKHPHLSYISEEDSGPPEAINKGIALARGEFIGILCLNDFYQPGTLNEVISLLPTLPRPAFLVGNCRMLDEKDELLYINKPEAFTPLQLLRRKPYSYNPAAYFYSRDLHRTAGPYPGCEGCDLAFMLRAFERARIRYFDRCWGNFRMTPDSITVKAIQSGTIEAGKDEIFAEYIRSRPLLRRLLLKAALLFGGNSR